ncbi:MAG: M28 family peptidase [Candidatus Thorarchaeota archaeon]
MKKSQFVFIFTIFLLPNIYAYPTITAQTIISPIIHPGLERVYGEVIVDKFYEDISTLELKSFVQEITANGTRYISGSFEAAVEGANKYARDYIIQQLIELSNGRIEIEVVGQYFNIVGKLPGYLPGEHPALVVSAHYDSPDGCPGANANGGGVAIMLALAKVMSQYEWPLDIYFMSFNGLYRHGPEDMYYMEGSEEVAIELRYSGFKTLALFNVDTVMFVNPNAPHDERIEVGYDALGSYSENQYWADLARSISNNYGDNAVVPVPSFLFSLWGLKDQYAFNLRGFSGAVCVSQSGYSYDYLYQTTNDVWDRPEYNYNIAKEAAATIGISMAYIMGRTYGEPRHFDFSIITRIGDTDRIYIPITTSTNIDVSCRWFGCPATFQLQNPNNQIIASAVFDSASAWEYTDVFNIAVIDEGLYTLSLINTGVQSIGFELSYSYDSDEDSDGILDSQEFWMDSIYFSMDQDSDGLSFADELFLGTDDNDIDSDSDLIPDKFEVDNGLNPSDPSDGNADEDGDGLTNAQEYTGGLNMFSADSDSDQMDDLWELENGLNPMFDDSLLDADGDGKTNLQEYIEETDPQQKELEEPPIFLWIVIPILLIAPTIGFLYIRREHLWY